MSLQINTYHGTYNRSWRNGGTSSIKYICIHYTATNAPALNNCIYFAGGNRNASADYFVDDSGIWEYNNPKDGYYTWAVGDGKGKYGITNANSISIEVVNAGGPFSAKEQKLLQELVTYLMETYNVPASRVVRHYDASRKQCPAYYASNLSAWKTLHSKITTKPTKGWLSMLTDYEQTELLNKVRAIYNEVTRTDDPSGRDKKMSTHTHVKWMAAKQADMNDKLDQILEEVKDNG